VRSAAGGIKRQLKEAVECTMQWPPGNSECEVFAYVGHLLT